MLICIESIHYHSLSIILPCLINIPESIDVNYRVITLISKNMVIYSSVWRIMHYSRYPRILQRIYTYTLRYIIYLGEPSGNIISIYHGTFIHIFIYWYDPKSKIYILNLFSR